MRAEKKQCPDCKNNLRQRDSKLLKDGRNYRAFWCSGCGRRFACYGSGEIWRTVDKRGGLPKITQTKNPGARVFVDGKFVGVAK